MFKKLNYLKILGYKQQLIFIIKKLYVILPNLYFSICKILFKHKCFLEIFYMTVFCRNIIFNLQLNFLLYLNFCDLFFNYLFFHSNYTFRARITKIFVPKIINKNIK